MSRLGSRSALIQRVVPTCQWRDAYAYADIADGGRAALAWELLRRDSDYVGFKRSGNIDHAIVDAAPEVVAARWGIHFCR